jgi:hypothetical protein
MLSSVEHKSYFLNNINTIERTHLKYNSNSKHDFVTFCIEGVEYGRCWLLTSVFLLILSPTIYLIPIFLFNLSNISRANII